VEDGVSGFRIDPRDVPASIAVIRRVLELSEAERTALGARAYMRVKQFDIVPTAEAMVGYLEGAAGASLAADRGVLS
jgi:hypothetical protein